MKKTQKTIALWVVILLLFAFVHQLMDQKTTERSIISNRTFHEAVEQGHVEEVYFKGENTIRGKFRDGYKVENKDFFELTASTGDRMAEFLQKNNIIPNYEKEEKQGLLTTLLVNGFPMILIFVIFWFFIRQIQIGGGKAMSFGKSKARMVSEHDKKVSFKDVAGIEEAKEELWEVVDFLKDPKKYTALGGKIPKGVLLVGPPGTGKTLLARAVAGEAGVPFFSISGSDFVEMFVGVGASRVRDLFEQGKKQAPCIVFIDEIDAVGRHRGAGMGGGHDEREQTLNQLLVEMDGFESNNGVILIAATNRIDVLDPALLRPGRFDRRVTVGRPDVRGRLGILTVHSRKTPLDEDVDLEVLAKGTPGFTGADLANLVNEAALIAARNDGKKLRMVDFEEAKDKVLMGAAKTSMIVSDEQKRKTAYHEAGHALVGMNVPETDPIHKVSIMPRGMALGVTQTLPDEELLNMGTVRANSFISFLMGGRCAEEITFNEKTNGAYDDIDRATQLARSMVCEWGMSEALGPIHYGKQREQPFAGMGDENKEYSEETARRIDEEVARIIQQNYERAKSVLVEHKEALVNVAEALIVWETLDKKQIDDVVAGKDIGVPLIKAKPKKKTVKKADKASAPETSEPVTA